MVGESCSLWVSYLTDGAWCSAGSLVLQVKYQGSRRFKLLAVDKDEKPYPIAAATWIDDQSNDTNEQQADMTAKLERDVYTLLQQVVKYSQLLSAEVSSSTKARQQALLPDPVLLYAPPPPMDSKQKGVADYMIKAGGLGPHDDIYACAGLSGHCQSLRLAEVWLGMWASAAADATVETDVL